MKEIKLSKGKISLVDNEDFDFINQWKWYYHNAGYAVKKEKGKSVFMHRIINNTPEEMKTDHINGNTLDNRKSNLRTVTHRQNLMNQKPQKGRTSKYKGVYWDTHAKKWRVQIKANKQTYRYGPFKTEEEGALCYNEKAKELHGEYAKLNNI